MALVNPNLEHLERAARALEPILEELVFVGGTLAGLLVDDPGAGMVRPTLDVDVVAEIQGEKGYTWARNTMTRLGFRPDIREGAPLCRWVLGEAVVDLMGSGDTPFGPTNRWYAEGFRSRNPFELPASGLRIHILTGPLFLLTKWEAYGHRGEGSMVGSRDIEDILIILDGRLGLEAEVESATPPARAGLAAMARGLLGSAAFRDYCLESLGERKGHALARLAAMAGLEAPSSR